MKRMRPFSLGTLLLAVACQSAPAPGTSCAHSTDCVSPLVCRYGRCRAECTSNRDCGASQSCILSSDRQGVCQLDLDLGCEDGVGRECPAGLVCANDRCINPCTTDADCPSDGACRLSPTLGLRVCVDPGRMDPDAGPPSDGGVPTSPCGTITDVCVGQAFACAIRDGRVWCWGDDNSAQHGDLRLSDYRPTQVLGPELAPLDGALEIGCGTAHACARLVGGDLVCWGAGGAGQLSISGAPDTDHAGYVQVDVTASEFASTPRLTADRLVIGTDHTFVHRAVNDHWVACGQNADGELRTTGTLGFGVSSLTYAGALDGARAIGVGLSHACSATATGVSCAGGSSNEELGDASLATLAGVTDLALGQHHACALGPSGIRCWGADDHGQLGDGPAVPTGATCTTSPCSFAPVTVALPGAARLVEASGSDGTCAITQAGELWCWGDNTRGQVDATFVDATAPVRQDGLGGAYVCDAAQAGRTLCALVASDAGGTVYCWGENGSGQIGLLPDGEMHAIPSPVALPP